MEQGKTKWFRKINRRWRGLGVLRNSWSVCWWPRVHIVTVCVWGFSAGYGMYMHPLMLHVKGPPVQKEHFMHFTCLYERSSKNPISFLSGDGEAWLWYIISGSETGMRVHCQNTQQHQGSHERRASYADKTENIFLRNPTWWFYCSSPELNVYLSVPHSKLGQAHLITQWRRNCGAGSEYCQITDKTKLDQLDSPVFFLFGCEWLVEVLSVGVR